MTTRKIAERVGIRQSNAQYYFPAKADLVRALFQQAIADDLRVLARQPAQSKAMPLRRMLATIDMFLSSATTTSSSSASCASSGRSPRTTLGRRGMARRRRQGAT